jgi:hypothetical protein
MKTGEEMFFTEGREDQEDREVEEWRGFEQKVAKEAKVVTGVVEFEPPRRHGRQGWGCLGGNDWGF